MPDLPPKKKLPAMKPLKGLGRGLDALLGADRPEPAPAGSEAPLSVLRSPGCRPAATSRVPAWTRPRSRSLPPRSMCTA